MVADRLVCGWWRGNQRCSPVTVGPKNAGRSTVRKAIEGLALRADRQTKLFNEFWSLVRHLAGVLATGAMRSFHAGLARFSAQKLA